ncbi:LPS assembly lipoprotein LptE [Devosia sp. SD17-2]|uniref:LPS assembly lipoprotein LptE n=1 Tax=Devosia sp. SD17-2 TaxID=2976459 RepID=UPI0023D8696E|nr:LPS assembly lipoprotein LptE [Devosia sp. SD17-2]WEJ33447.1 hypothetical protein NYQ88_01080 [Devosia sp. SD17-2]
MSLFRPSRIALIALSLSGGVALSACSFQPVHSGRLAEAAQMQLAYAAPNTRLEQIVYQELSFRLGTSARPDAPLVSISVRPETAVAFRSQTANPHKLHEARVTGDLVITYRDNSGRAPVRVTRTATAQFNRSGQVLAEQAAELEAQERAAKALAESLRLAIYAALAP